MMALLAPSINVVQRELWQARDCINNNYYSGSAASVSLHGGGLFAGEKRRPRRGRRAEAFWQMDVSSRPSAIEMVPITGMEEFDEALRRSQEQQQPILVDWMAAWCRKCIYLKPKLEKLAAEFHPRIKFYVVDVNNVPQALVKRGNISKMPTIQLWKDGEWKDEIIGGHKAWLVVDEVRDMIRKNL